MSEERLIELESRLAHQDQTILELNDVVTDQQSRIMQLERLCQSMAERIASLAESGRAGSSDDERPPHY